MRKRSLGLAVAVLALGTACTPRATPGTDTTVLVSSTPQGTTVNDAYLESFATTTDASAPGSEAPDLGDGEALVLDDRAVLGASPGADGPPVFLSTKVKVLESGQGQTKVQTADGTQGWVPSGVLALEGRRAVLKADGPNGWPRLTFVVYRPAAGNPATVDVVAAAPGGEPRQTTVARSLLATATADVNLVVLWRLAALETEPAAQLAVLNQALAKYSSSSFAPLVQERLEALAGKTVLATTEVSLIVSATADGTRVWPEPVEGKGTPVGELSAGQQVQVVEQSTEAQTVNGVSARWYKIADPVGWVFGAQVSQ